MKALVAYYSRTGTTKKVAEEVASQLKSDIEEIRDARNRKGISGWLSAGKDATQKNLTTLEKAVKTPSAYDIVVVGTPLWNKRMTPAARTYLTQNKDALRKVAFFCTHQHTDDDPFEDMGLVCGKAPVATLILHKKTDIEAGSYADKLKDFVDKINS